MLGVGPGWWRETAKRRWGCQHLQGECSHILSLVSLNQGQESQKGVFRLAEKSLSGKQTHVSKTGSKPGVSATSLLPHGPSSGGVSLCPCLQFPGQEPVLGTRICLRKGGKSWRLTTGLISGKDRPLWDQQEAEGQTLPAGPTSL